MNYKLSKYFYGINELIVLFTITICIDFFISLFFPTANTNLFNIICSIVYITIIILSFRFFFCEQFDKKRLQKELDRLEKISILMREFPNNPVVQRYEFLKEIYSKISEKNLQALVFFDGKNPENSIGFMHISYCALFIVCHLSVINSNHFIASIFIIILTFSLIYYVFQFVIDLIEKVPFNNPISQIKIIMLFTTLILSRSTIVNFWGKEEFNSYIEKPHYSARYYVNLFENEKSSKNYRLEADVTVTSEKYYSDEPGKRVGVPIFIFSPKKIIYLNKVYWPNGGFLIFDDTHLKVGQRVYGADQNGKEWYIELTNQKVSLELKDDKNKK